MEEKKFRAQFFGVRIPEDAPVGQLPFEEAVRTVSLLEVGQKQKHVSSKLRRMDEYWEEDNLLFMNFTTFNYVGPNRVKVGGQSQSFSMANDEYFGEETALLYDMDRGSLLVEQTQKGMGPGSVAKYFEIFAGQGATYEVFPVVDKEIAARLRRYRIFRRLRVRVLLDPVNKYDQDEGTSLITAFGERFDAKVMDLDINLGRIRKGTLSPGFIIPPAPLRSATPGPFRSEGGARAEGRAGRCAFRALRPPRFRTETARSHPE